MSIINNRISALGETKSRIKNKLISKGVTITNDTKFSFYSTKIDEIPTSESTSSTSNRPSNWPIIDNLVSDGDEKFVGLFNGINCSLVCSGNYTVDWGDGSIINYDSGVTASKTYSSLEYRVITITPQNGQMLTSIRLGVLENSHTNWLDIKMSGSNITILNLRPLGSFDSTRLTLFNFIGENYITGFERMFSNFINLKTVLVKTSNGINFNDMFAGCISLVNIPLIDTSKGTNFSNMFGGCTLLRTIPLLDTSKGTNFSRMFELCTSLLSIPKLDLSKGTNFQRMFSGCRRLSNIPFINSVSGTNFSLMFENCISLTSINISLKSCDNINSMFWSCINVTNINISDMEFEYEISYNNRHFLANCNSLESVTGLNIFNMYQPFGWYPINISIQSIRGQVHFYSLDLRNTNFSANSLEDFFEKTLIPTFDSPNILVSNILGIEPSVTTMIQGEVGSNVYNVSNTSELKVGMSVSPASNVTTSYSGVTHSSDGNIFTRANHGLTNDTPVSFSSAVFSPEEMTRLIHKKTTLEDESTYEFLVNKAFYYVVNSTTNTFQIAKEPGGVPLELNDDVCTVRFSNKITNIVENKSITLSVPAQNNTSVDVTFRMLNTRPATLKGYVIVG